MSFITLVFCVTAALGSPAQTVTTLYSFCAVKDHCTDGASPEIELLQATDGNFYGTTFFGGATRNCCGTVFKITASGALTTLYTFDGPDGVYPHGSLIQATDGNFYGTTSQGGAVGKGTVFKITPAGTLTTLYSFCSQTNCADGATPQSGLIQATNGNFYGTTYGGGANGYGSIFKMTAEGTPATIYSFCSQPNCADGSLPYAGLLQATDGNFYGTTQGGGSSTCGTTNSCGTFFQLTPAGVLTTLYNFCSQPNCADGGLPTAGLIQATDGNFYGTTSSTTFRMTPTGTLTTLYTFVTTGIQIAPNQLVQASDGNLYGTTYGYSPNGPGLIYRITPNDVFTTIYKFDGNSYGGRAQAGLIQASNGNLYGTTGLGGAALCGGGGTVFSLVLSPSTVTISPTSLGFCSRSIDEVSVAKTVKLKNTGTAPLTIVGITTNGNFAISANTCGAALPAGKTCDVGVTATPTVLGPQTGVLTFNDSAANSPQTVLLTATGVEPATLGPTKAAFPKQKVGTTSAAKTFTLINYQALELTSIAISVTGDFTVSSTTCGTSLGASGKCTISVKFTPTQIGTRTGQLSVTDSAANSPQTSTLKGAGE